MVDIDKLIRKASPGSPQVCEILMDAYYDFVYNLAVSFLCDPYEAEDAAQETFIRATQHIDHYQAGTGIKSWLAKITINLCRDRYRRKKFSQRLLEILKGITPHSLHAWSTLEDDLILDERRSRLKQAIDALDDKHRFPVLLRYYHGLSVHEIARTLGLNEGTVHSRLHYAHLKLRDQLGELSGEIEGDEEKIV
jgi:RNA polymerase sigma factor (sigma-70 family)